MNINESVGAQVRHLRQAQGSTQQELAEKSGLSVDHIGKIERGITSPTVEALDQVANGLGVKLQAFFELHTGSEVADQPATELANLIRYLRDRTTDDVEFASSIVRQILDR